LGDNIYLGTSELAKYPFLTEAKERLAKIDVDVAMLGSLKDVVDRARQRIIASFASGRDMPNKNLEVEITSFPVAVLLVAGVNDDTLTKRYALFEAKKMANYLVEEKDETVFMVASFFNWKKITSFLARGVTPDASIDKYRIHFVDYLNNATSSLVHDMRWKLANHLLEKGQLEVTKREICRLLQEEIQRYIEQLAVGKLPLIPQNIKDTIGELKGEYTKIKPHIDEFEKMRTFAEEFEYPPCIQRFYQKMSQRQHLSHIERFALVTYLLHQGISADAVVSIFTSLSDYRKDLTRYQVEHLAGRRGSGTTYIPPNCATLRTHGVCVAPNDPICQTIKNPLTYHLRKKSVKGKG
jgi:DNA primase large subunit